MGRQLLLVCGILSSLLYVAMNVFIPMQFDGYSIADQTVSELSAIGAPTRRLWVWLAMIFILLYAAFGWGVLLSAGTNRRLRVAGWLILAYCAINFYWPPMQLRGNEMALTDILHITWAMVALLLMILIMGFGAAGLGKGFRWYTGASFVVFMVFGTLTGLGGNHLAANLPTPMLGVWERINIGVFLLWVVVLAVVLLWSGRRGPVPTTLPPRLSASH
ncbi:MAG: DUF998 domain-containing protein [Bacteroidetes bacterium]|nr:MAG: DUF998 domain-containing protein [Bacteroidota bacterium]